MLADVSEFSEYLPAPSEAALTEVRSLSTCSLCDSPTLIHNASLAMTVLWLEAHDPAEAANMRSGSGGGAGELEPADARGGRSGGSPDPPIETDLEWEVIRKRAAIDSILSPGYALPLQMIGAIAAHAEMTPELEDFVPDAFLAMICGRCDGKVSPVEDIAPRLLGTYLNLHFDGDRAAAERQRGPWQLVEEFVRIVDATARTFRQSA
jgi:hypothetical protein